MDLAAILTWDHIGIIATVLALVVTVWQLYGGPGQQRAARQELLNVLPTPSPRPFSIDGQTSFQSEADYVMANSLDIATLNSSLAAPSKAIHKALRKLINQGKIEVFIHEGELVGDARFAGKKALIPFFFKGGMSPSLRPTSAKLEMAINAVQSNSGGARTSN